MMALLLQGCASDFHRKYDAENAVKEDLPNTTPIEATKAKPYTKYNSAYLGQKVQYSVEQQRLMGKHVKISSYEPATLAVILDAVAAQTGVSYRIEEKPKGIAKAETNGTRHIASISTVHLLSL